MSVMSPNGLVSSQYDHDLHIRFSRCVEFGDVFDCWIWKGALAASKRAPNYRWGVMRAWGKSHKASRVSWILNRGDIPDGLNVCHDCDNPMCVNPGHLFLGTQADNVTDMDEKARRRNAPLLGPRHPNAKLTLAQVEIIRRHVGSATPLARQFGVSPEQINNIRRGAQRKAG